MTALDLFCGAGGVSMGLHRAGFDCTGVDLSPQKRYPFRFVQADALTVPLEGYDFVWASPPCQAHTALRHVTGRQYEDLIPAMRARLIAWGGPWIIENVIGAPLRNAVMLCGTSFGLGCEGAELRRHRIFESNMPIMGLECQHGVARAVIGVYGQHTRARQRVATIGVYGHSMFNETGPNFSIAQGREAMGIDWMTQSELSQAIPPAYSEFLGRQIMEMIS